MKTKVNAFIRKHQLLNKKQPLLIGFSGGVDSVVLLHFLINEGYNCKAAHVNFNLRGTESEEDEIFVRGFCQKHEVELFTISEDTNAYAKEHKYSIEMAAREIRYNFFHRLIDQHNLQGVAVAHHSDDVVETFLLNLTRGAGLKGLSGIAPKNGPVIRPFVDISRKEVQKYALDHKLAFRTDSSNYDTRIRRNYFRHELIPAFFEINPSFPQTILQTTKYMKQAHSFLSKSVDSFIKKYVEKEENRWEIPIEALNKTHSPELFLFEILSPFGFNSNQIEEMMEHNHATSGKWWYAYDKAVLLDRNSFILVFNKHFADKEEYLISVHDTEITTPIPLNIAIETDFNLQKAKIGPGIAIFDKRNLQYPLKLRRWQKGDWFTPFGMKGRKKLSDFFIDQKIPNDIKESTWVLTSGKDIIWIVGHRTDNRYRVTEDCKKVVIFSVQE